MLTRLEYEHQQRALPYIKECAKLFEKYATQTYLQFPKEAIAPNDDLIPVNETLIERKNK